MKEVPLSFYRVALGSRVAEESGAAAPHSTTLPRIIVAAGKFREVLECDATAPLSHSEPAANRRVKIGGPV